MYQQELKTIATEAAQLDGLQSAMEDAATFLGQSFEEWASSCNNSRFMANELLAALGDAGWELVRK